MTDLIPIRRELLERALPYLSNTPDLVQIGAEELAGELRALLARPAAPADHSVDVGLSPEEWNQRALPAINPQPPTVAITWHDSPESVHRAMWEESAVAAGMTYEQMLAESVACGEDEHGNEIEFSHEQELAGIRQQGCWGFVDARTNMIHAWASDSAPREFILHMLAHEIGHVTDEPHPDELQEEMRAEQFGRVAKLAYELLPQDLYDYEALADENERLRVKLMTIASADPRYHGIEWAKAHAAENDNRAWLKWKEAIDQHDHLRTKLAKARELLVMVRQDGWYHPLEEHEIAQIDAAMSAGKDSVS